MSPNMEVSVEESLEEPSSTTALDTAQSQTPAQDLELDEERIEVLEDEERTERDEEEPLTPLVQETVDDLDDEDMEMVRVSGGGGVPSWAVGQEEEVRFLGGFCPATRKKYTSLFPNSSNMGFHNLFYVVQNNPLAIWEKGVSRNFLFLCK